MIKLSELIMLLFVLLPLIIGALDNKLAAGIKYSLLCFIIAFLSWEFRFVSEFHIASRAHSVSDWSANGVYFVIIPEALVLFYFALSFFSRAPKGTDLDKSLLNLRAWDFPISPMATGGATILTIFALLVSLFSLVLSDLLNLVYAVFLIIVSCYFVSRLRQDKTAIPKDTEPETSAVSSREDFIIEPIEEKPTKLRFVCTQCHHPGNIPISKLPVDRPKVALRCPKCGYKVAIKNPQYHKTV